MKPKNLPQRLLLVCRRLEEFYPARVPVSPCQKEQVKLTLPLSQLAQDFGGFYCLLWLGWWLMESGNSSVWTWRNIFGSHDRLLQFIAAAVKVLEAGNT